MAFHVPFNQRPRPHDNAVYIGFDEPQQQQYRQQRIYRRNSNSNGFGVGGFVLSIGSIFTGGLLAPIALLFSLIGLRKSPRGMATAGTVISSMMLVFMGLAVAGASLGEKMVRDQYRDHSRRTVRVQKHKKYEAKIKKTNAELAKAAALIREYRSENSGSLPDAIVANKMLYKAEAKDAWDKDLRYEIDDLIDSPSATIAVIRSAGSDEKFDTGDDLITRIPAGTMRTSTK